MTDRELLEAAAMAAGYDWRDKTMNVTQAGVPVSEWPYDWNPLTDDGDALRLAVKLRMDIAHFSESVRADVTGHGDCHELNYGDPCAATRRAIVRAAASLAKEQA